MSKTKFLKILTAVLILFLFYMGAIIVKSDFWGNLLSPLCAAVATCLSLYVYLKSDRAKAINIVWLFLCLAMLAWTMGDILWGIYNFLLLDPSRSVLISFLYFLTNLNLVIVAIIYVFFQLKKWNGVQLLLDAVAISISILLFIWIVIFNKNPQNIHSLVWDRLMLSAAILLDIGLLAGIFILFLAMRNGKQPVFIRVIAAGMLLFVTTDLFFFYLYYHGVYKSNSIIDGVYMASLLLISLGALWKENDRTADEKEIFCSNIGFSRREIYLLIFPIVAIIVEGIAIGDLMLYALIITIYIGASGHVQAAIKNEAILREELGDSEAKYRALAENSPDIIIRFDRNCRHLYVNPAIEKAMGIPAERFLGKSHRELGYSSQYCRYWEERIKTVFASGNTWEGLFKKEGNNPLKIYNLRLIPEYGADGNPATILCIAADMTDLMKAEELLRQSEERLQLALEAAKEGIWDWNAATGELFISLRCYQMLGYDGTDQITPSYENCLRQIVDEDRESVAGQIAFFLEAKLKDIELEFRLRTKDGGRLWAVARGEVITRDRRGEPLRLIGTLTDITKSKEADQALKNNEAKFKGIFHQSPLAIELFDSAGRLIEVNKAALDLFGIRDISDIINFNYFNSPFIPEEVRVQLLQGINVEYEMRYDFDRIKQRRFYATVNSGRRILRTIASPLGDEATGNRIGYLVQIEDITLQKNAEAEILKQSARAESLLRIAARLNANLELETVLATVCEETVGVLNVAAATVSLYEAENGVFVCHVGHGFPTDGNLRDLEPPLAAIFKNRPADQNRKVMFISDIQRGAAHPKPEPSAEMELYPLACIGIEHGEELVGALTVYNRNYLKNFTDDELIILQGLADQAGLAIVNARLFKEVKLGRERLKILNQQVVTAQEEERRRLSRELHDEAGQALTALKIFLELIRADIPDTHLLLQQRMNEAVALTGATLEQIRILARDLRPPVLDALGLNEALNEYCHDFARRVNIKVSFSGCKLPVIPDEVSISLYRLLQEALTNAAKHSQAKEITVRLTDEKTSLKLIIEDDGVGFDKSTLTEMSRTRGVGLLGVAERLEMVGGVLRIFSVTGRGTRLVAKIPRKFNLLKKERP